MKGNSEGRGAPEQGARIIGEWKGIKEPFSGLSHLAGAILSAVALIALLILSHGRIRHTVGVTIYGLSLILLYTTSALYHSLPVGERAKFWLRRFDHMAIYLLIAGSYAPVCLIVLRGGLGLGLLIAVYALALVGIGCTLFWRNAPSWVRVVLYIGMGWLVMAALRPLQALLTPREMVWLVAGGVVYTLGVLVYATKRPRLWPGKFDSHDLWHLFVLGGSACQMVAMIFIVAS